MGLEQLDENSKQQNDIAQVSHWLLESAVQNR